MSIKKQILIPKSPITPVINKSPNPFKNKQELKAFIKGFVIRARKHNVILITGTTSINDRYQPYAIAKNPKNIINKSRSKIFNTN